MPDTNINIVGILIFVTAMALIPLAVATMTAFLKISIVLFIVRNALGLQQSPPGLVLYGIALVLTVYVTMPLAADIHGRLSARPPDLRSAAGLAESASAVRAPLQAHLMRFTHESERRFFMSATVRVWPESARADLKDDDLVVLMPAFISSELTRAFEIGFLLYLPFLVIDLVVSNVLMAMGMIMVSPTLISVPLKLLLFVVVEGWSRLLHGLILSYG
jgi:type III secretion protein R